MDCWAESLSDSWARLGSGRGDPRPLKRLDDGLDLEPRTWEPTHGSASGGPVHGLATGPLGHWTEWALGRCDGSALRHHPASQPAQHVGQDPDQDVQDLQRAAHSQSSQPTRASATLPPSPPKERRICSSCSDLHPLPSHQLLQTNNSSSLIRRPEDQKGESKGCREKQPATYSCCDPFQSREPDPASAKSEPLQEYSVRSAASAADDLRTWANPAHDEPHRRPSSHHPLYLCPSASDHQGKADTRHAQNRQSKLSQEQLAELQKSTHFDKKELQQWYKGAHNPPFPVNLLSPPT
ncbi:calcium-binding protein NCS-1 [Diaporthe helianthi]|uniref:Calcium-binding protein NCS-1 n=1 Tax=Diaporthe helianthi TaxID=158607 RepID=A0A2P5HGK9_DIAHE|nr:calcium-binding protein NCS-1 [Diaporthe helianthi]